VTHLEFFVNDILQLIEAAAFLGVQGIGLTRLHGWNLAAFIG
jgi:hypothetical protein